VPKIVSIRLSHEIKVQMRFSLFDKLHGFAISIARVNKPYNDVTGWKPIENCHKGDNLNHRSRLLKAC
jgi:hypothetical protein